MKNALGTTFALIMGFVGIWFIDLNILPIPPHSIFLSFTYYLFFVCYMYLLTYKYYASHKITSYILYTVSLVLIIDIFNQAYSDTICYYYPENFCSVVETIQKIPLVVYLVVYGLIFDIVKTGSVCCDRDVLLRNKYSGIILSGSIFLFVYTIQKYIPISILDLLEIGNVEFAFFSISIFSGLFYMLFVYKYFAKYKKTVTLIFVFGGILIAFVNQIAFRVYIFSLYEGYSQYAYCLNFLFILGYGFLFDITKFSIKDHSKDIIKT